MTNFGSRDYSRQFAVSNPKETKQSCQNEKPHTFWKNFVPRARMMVYKMQKVRQSYLGSQNCVKVLKPRVPTFSRKEIVHVLRTGLSQAGGGGRADQLTLFQPGGHIIPTQYYVPPPRIFRPCDGPAP